jgi:hypothetical protein
MSAEITFISKESGLLQNTSLFPKKVSLVRMSAAILINLADTAIREATVCCIHVLRVVNGFI